MVFQLVCFRVIYVHNKKRITLLEVHTMNEKITNQIEEMKKQTIGVEVEMNSMVKLFIQVELLLMVLMVVFL